MADGWAVTALTLDMTGDSRLLSQARKRASEIGIPLVIKDVRTAFSSITDYFVGSYATGRTPAPCTLCNTAIKWPSLVAEADRLGIRAVATGHYFNTVRYNGRIYVSRADDRTKDQSYYLWGLPQSTLERIITPMAHTYKSDLMHGTPSRRESMGVCFLGGMPYARYIADRCPATAQPGDVVDAGGRIVGRHDGTAFYTIGQKRGLHISETGMCIIDIDAANNRIVVGRESQLYYTTLEIESYNIVDMDELLSANDIEVVIRGIGRNPQGYMLRAVPVMERIRIVLGSPAWAPAVGQPAVFYRDGRVIGGGIVGKYY